MLEFWRRYHDGTPEYLARHYWWAYLDPIGVWFFDHYPIINLILFGQYRNILNEVMRRYAMTNGVRTLQLTCAYGSLSPTLARAANTHELHLMDVAAIQLHAAQRKIPTAIKPALYARTTPKRWPMPATASIPWSFFSCCMNYPMRHASERCKKPCVY